jgi:transposase
MPVTHKNISNTQTNREKQMLNFVLEKYIDGLPASCMIPQLVFKTSTKRAIGVSGKSNLPLCRTLAQKFPMDRAEKLFAQQYHVISLHRGGCYTLSNQKYPDIPCSSKLKPRCHYSCTYRYKRRYKAVCCSLLSSTRSLGTSGDLSDFERGLVIGCHISKKSVRDIATLLKLPRSTVGDVIVKWKHEGTITTKRQSGRPRLMTDRDRRVLKKVVRETRQTSSETITHEFHSATNCPANTMTVHQEFKRNRVPWPISCP